MRTVPEMSSLTNYQHVVNYLKSYSYVVSFVFRSAAAATLNVSVIPPSAAVNFRL